MKTISKIVLALVSLVFIGALTASATPYVITPNDWSTVARPNLAPTPGFGQDSLAYQLSSLNDPSTLATTMIAYDDGQFSYPGYYTGSNTVSFLGPFAANITPPVSSVLYNASPGLPAFLAETDYAVVDYGPYSGYDGGYGFGYDGYDGYTGYSTPTPAPAPAPASWHPVNHHAPNTHFQTHPGTNHPVNHHPGPNPKPNHPVTPVHHPHK